MSSFWWNFHHWLHWKLSKWQLPVQPVIKISSKWRHFRFSECQMNIARFRVISHQFAIENVDTTKRKIILPTRQCGWRNTLSSPTYFNETGCRSSLRCISNHLDNVYKNGENESCNDRSSHVPQILFALGRFISECFKKCQLYTSRNDEGIIKNPYVNASACVYVRGLVVYKRT